MALEARLRKGVTSVQYRKLGNTGLDVSVLSIGAMRLPKEMDEAVALLRQAIDAGCNYIDTSRGYGDSELKLAAALTDGCREKVILSTKCSPWIYKEEGYTAGADDARRKIDDSMQRLAVDRLDFYQVWNVDNAENYAKAIAPGAMVDGIRKAMDEGLVDHIAATTHAPEPVVLGMIDSGLFETITVTYHLLDRRRERVMARAHDKGVGVVVMNPMGGGVLGHPSRVIREFLPESQLSSQALSLKFVLDNPHVSCAISGLSKPSDVVENVQAAETAPLSAAQRDRLAGGAADLEAEAKQFCTQCRYCVPCEQKVDIPGIFAMILRARLFGLGDWARTRYARMKPERRGDQCNQCGVCEEKCTNKLPIREELEKAHAFLTP